MKTSQEFERLLNQIDGKGYKAYKDIQGSYQFKDYILSIDYVQGDPFASPSRIRIILPQKFAKFPQNLHNYPHKKWGFVDYLSRLVGRNIKQYYDGVGGSGKSGLLTIGYCGQEILERNFIIIDGDKVEVRLEVGLPAAGRRILGREAKSIFFEALPVIVEKSLYYENINQVALKRQVELCEDQYYLRQEISKRNLVAFVANGSILPRESGVSQRPLKKGAIPFQSPASYEIEIELPYKGKIKGMGIPEGVTLIVGGGFHGKSTLLQAIELGVYNHIEGDGREFVITRESAVKIKAENGRQVEKVNIAPFINNLPMGQDTVAFSTENASGSTSQATNIMEALEVGTDLLLIDEDTSATNFMIRDGRMQKLVQKNKEPITPFIDKVRELYEEQGVATIIVIGGSGDYFEVADHVIMMDEYIPTDATEEAKTIAQESSTYRKIEESSSFGGGSKRVVLKSSFPKNHKGVKIKARGLGEISYNKTDIELRDLEQLVDSNQTNAIAFMLEYMMNHLVNNQLSIGEIVDKIHTTIQEKGLDVVSPFRGHPGNMALPRRQEIAGAINRFRNLKIK